LVRKLDGKRPLGRLRSRWDYDFKLGVLGIYTYVIHMPQDRAVMAVFDTVMNIQVP
jgi:hypothetical protein